MGFPKKEAELVRDLARQVAAIANLPVHEEKAEMWRKLNRLEPVRPMVELHNGAWNETLDDSEAECTDKWLRSQELAMKRALYGWEHLRGDSVFDSVIYSPLKIHDTGFGVQIDVTRPDHYFGASHFNPVIEDGADPEEFIRIPEVTVDWEGSERNHQRLSELYDGIMPVKKRGVTGSWFAIFDEYIQWRSLEKAFVDMCDNPEWLHRILDRMTVGLLSRLDQLEAQGALALNNGDEGPCNIGSGGLGITDELPGDDFDAQHVRPKDTWGHATTQIFSEVSPAMHEEFGLRYESRWLERFGLCNYGCCEPLDRKVDIIQNALPNLRRLSMSPWVDVARGAEAIGNSCIFSWKPNPAILGGEKWNPEVIRQYIRDALEKTRGCSVEIIMKDLHTCRNEPNRMWEWCDIVMEEAERIAE